MYDEYFYVLIKFLEIEDDKIIILHGIVNSAFLLNGYSFALEIIIKTALDFRWSFLRAYFVNSSMVEQDYMQIMSFQRILVSFQKKKLNVKGGLLSSTFLFETV